MNISKKTHTQTVPTYPDLGQVGSLLGTAWDTCDTHQENGLSSTKFFLFNRNSNAADKHQNQTNNTKMNKGCNIKVFLFYRTISLISNPSKVMLKIILNRLKPQAEKIIAEEQAETSEQAGATKGRSSTYESSVRHNFTTSKTSVMSS